MLSWNTTDFTYYLHYIDAMKNILFSFLHFNASITYLNFSLFIWRVRETREHYPWTVKVCKLNFEKVNFYFIFLIALLLNFQKINSKNYIFIIRKDCNFSNQILQAAVILDKMLKSLAFISLNFSYSFFLSIFHFNILLSYGFPTISN